MAAVTGVQLVVGRQSDAIVPGGDAVSATLTCPAGSSAVAGGYRLVFEDPNDESALSGLVVSVNGPVPPSSWEVTVILPAVSRPLAGAVRLQAEATCVGG
jgi:hypothetical protein